MTAARYAYRCRRCHEWAFLEAIHATYPELAARSRGKYVQNFSRYLTGGARLRELRAAERMHSHRGRMARLAAVRRRLP